MHGLERAIGEIAGRQDNVITREQLLGTGLGRGAIAHRVIAGNLRRLHRGVYLVGYAPPTPTARVRAAVFACGDGAVLSHRSAAELWELLPPAHQDVDVAVAARNPGVRPGIRVHRVEALWPRETSEIRQVPITSPARTVCDVAGTEPAREAQRALAEARTRRLVSDRDLWAVIGRAPARRGCAFVRALLDREIGPGLTRSEAELKLVELIGAAGLPAAETNVRVCGVEVDFMWRGGRLVVEVDGHAFHGHRAAFERDRRRDQVLVAAGYRVIRVTWRQLVDEPLVVIARVAQALGGGPLS